MGGIFVGIFSRKCGYIAESGLILLTDIKVRKATARDKIGDERNRTSPVFA